MDNAHLREQVESDDESYSGDPFNFDHKFNSFDEAIAYNISWINNEIEDNVLSGQGGYANNGRHAIEPVKYNKELMIKLNKLGFLTTSSQGGAIVKTEQNEIMERSYVDGYLRTDHAKKLQNFIDLRGKQFQHMSYTQNVIICYNLL